MASSQAPFAAKAKVACAGGLADGIAANRPWPAFLELFSKGSAVKRLGPR